MPLPLAIPIIASAATSIPSWIQAYKQKKRADELEKELNRPTMDIPESQKRALMSAENQAGMTRLPGQSAIEGRLDQNTANQVDMVERLGPGGATSINAASQAYGQQMGKENELGISAANMWLGNQDRLRSELNRNAEWENKVWDYNERQPYETKAMAIGALREGSDRNLNNGVQDLFGGIANVTLSDYLYGKGGSPSWITNLLGGNQNQNQQQQDPTMTTSSPQQDSEAEISGTTKPGSNWLFDYNNNNFPIMERLIRQ